MKKTNDEKYEMMERLCEMKDDLMDMHDELVAMLEQPGSLIHHDHPWIANLRCVIDNEHEYLSRGETLQTAIDELEEDILFNDDEDEDDDGSQEPCKAHGNKDCGSSMCAEWTRAEVEDDITESEQVYLDSRGER